VVSLESWQHFHEAGNLAIARGLYDNAIAEYKKALAVALQTSDHSSHAQTLRALAKTYLEVNKIHEAKQTISEARDLDISFWGDDSQNVGEDVFILAEILRREGDLVNARKLYEQVLSIRTIFLGDNHEEVLDVLLRLVWIGLEEGRYDGLVKLTHRATEIFRQVHPAGVFGKSLNMEALLQPYMVQGRHLEAELICQRALHVLRTVLGDRNPDIVEVLNDYSAVMKAAKKHLSAWHLKSRSQSMNELNSLERQADTFVHTGNLQEAEVCLRRLLANLQKRVAPDRILVSRVLRKYADVVLKLGRATDAELLRRQAHNWEPHDELSDVPPDLLFWL
jgi:tetratricopeptide (TPR) repeat protein